MEAVDCTEYSPLSGANNFACILENLANFASTHGWTVDELRVGYKWNTGYPSGGWIAGDQGFLQLHCNDALRPMTWRLQSAEINPHHSYLYKGLVVNFCNDTSRTYNTAISTLPIDQGGKINNTIRGLTVSYLSTNPLKQWVCGNSKWVFMAVQVSSTRYISMFFGIPDLLNPNSTVGHMLWKTALSYNSTGWPSYTDWDLNKEFLTGPWSSDLSGGPGTGYPGASGSSLYGFCGSNIKYLSTGGSRLNYRNGIGFTMQRLLQQQSWSGKRFIVIPLIYQHPAPMRIFTPFAYMPIGMVRWEGLEGGQSLFYGAEEYKVFPFLSAYVNSTTSGIYDHAGWIVRVK